MKKKILYRICIFVVLLSACGITPTPQVIIVSATAKTEEQVCSTRFPDCHPWNTVNQYVGLNTCFVGRVSRTLLVTDESNQRNLWNVYFDPAAFMMPENRADIIDTETASAILSQTNGLVLILAGGVPQENSCIAVFGKVYNERMMIDSKGDRFNPEIVIEKCSCGY